MKNNNNTTSGIGFCGLLCLIFITLKLIGYINWSWWLVLLPFYGPLAIALVILLAAALIDHNLNKCLNGKH